MMTVWRIKGKIIRTVLCCVLYDSCAQWYTHTQAVFTVDCWFRFTPCQRLRINSNNLLSNVHILEAWRWSSQNNKSTSFIALTLLAGRQEDNLACKNWVVRYWYDYLSEASCKWFAYGPDDASATPSSLASFMVALCNRADHIYFHAVVCYGRPM